MGSGLPTELNEREKAAVQLFNAEGLSKAASMVLSRMDRSGSEVTNAILAEVGLERAVALVERLKDPYYATKLARTRPWPDDALIERLLCVVIESGDEYAACQFAEYVPILSHPQRDRLIHVIATSNSPHRRSGAQRLASVIEGLSDNQKDRLHTIQ